MRNRRSKTAFAAFVGLAAAALLVACRPTGLALTKVPKMGKADWAVYFSPDGGCTDAVVAMLNQARKSVLVQAYSFTSAPIAKALVNAHKRGVKVQAILDKSNWSEKYSAATFLRNMGIPTYIDAAHAIAHNKVMIIDGGIVITGSFNFTKAAEQHNAENLVILWDQGIASRYTRNWQLHLSHSEKYTGMKGYRVRSRA